MDLPRATYLFGLAGLSISFVGFSTIAITFLKATDAEMSDKAFNAIRIFFTTGILAAAFSLLPLLLRLLDLSTDLVWRLSSALLAIVGLMSLVTRIRALLQVQSWPIPLRILVNLAISVLVSVLLGLNAAGLLFDPYIGPYPVGVTWQAAISPIIFAENLSIFFQRRPKE
jgi:ABC-type glucose/galactose transport system permease subunit